jgi:hypothetical protein
VDDQKKILCEAVRIGGAMRARLWVAGFAIVVSLCVWIPAAAGAVGAAQTSATNLPASVSLCERGGWQSLTNVQGQPFDNQGQCISYFIHNPVSLADLAGSFAGTASYAVLGDSPCFATQVFDATYPGTSAVGPVTLHLDGCDALVSIFPFTYYFTGTFTITTNVGTLHGNAAGPLGDPFPIVELTLTVLSGTEAFAATTGTINVSIQWDGASTSMTGSVTIP